MTETQFNTLGLSENILKEVERRGFTQPTAIQEQAIPLILKNEKDIIAKSQTGTGKTAAFGLPILDMLDDDKGHVQALIMVPTRELALQVAEELDSFTGRRKISILPVYGGQSMSEQLRRLKKGVDIVVGTPGRIIDHINRRSLALEKISFAVLDEADEMLNMGFIEDIEEILGHTAGHKRTVLFSATMPPHIHKIAQNYMGEYDIIEANGRNLIVEKTEQIYYEVRQSDKFEALCRIMDMEDEFYGLIFTSTRIGVDELTNLLLARGYEAEGIHGDISQQQRERALGKFRNGNAHIMVATNVAARGIDITDLTHVINYSLPQNAEEYIHRIGRTGRAGKKGTAITLISPSENRRLKDIAARTKSSIRKEKLPTVSDIKNARKERLFSEIMNNTGENPGKEFIEMAVQLLSGNEPLDVVASLLQHSFKNSLDMSVYKEIKDIPKKSDKKARVVLSKGKKDGLSPRQLLRMIKNETGIGASVINDICIKERQSFLTVPVKDANKIIKICNRGKGRDKMTARIAENHPGDKKPSRRAARRPA